MKEGIFVIKRIYKDFIIAFLNSRGEIPFTFLKERLKEETLLNPHSIRFYDSHLALWASHRAGIYPSAYRGKRPKSSACKLP